MKTALLLLGLLSSPLVAVCSVFVTWGDSLTAGFGGTPYPTQLEALTGITTLNQGVNGLNSSQIASRFLAHPELFGEKVVIWAGKNNFLDPSAPDNAFDPVIDSDLASMVSRLTTPAYLVLGLISSQDEPLGSLHHNAFTIINTHLAATYAGHFIDIEHVLVRAYDPLSPADVLDFNADVTPTSLRSDNAHLNTAGYGVVARTVADYFASVPEPAQTAEVVAAGCALAALGLRKRRT